MEIIGRVIINDLADYVPDKWIGGEIRRPYLMRVHDSGKKPRAFFAGKKPRLKVIANFDHFGIFCKFSMPTQTIRPRKLKLGTAEPPFGTEIDKICMDRAMSFSWADNPIGIKIQQSVVF